MSKFWTIMSHTFMTRLKSKAFIITNIIMLILIIGLVNIQSIMDVLGGKEKTEIIVLDTSDVYFSELKTNVEAASENMTLTAYDKSESEGQQAVQDEQYSALLTIDLDENSNPKATYYANNIDRKSTRLNSSHVAISYAVFCLKKKTYATYLWFP